MLKENIVKSDWQLVKRAETILENNKENGYSCDFKNVSQEQASELIRILKESGKSVVLVSGVFDLWHVGYLKLFDESRKYGDILGVATPTDKQIKENKNPQLPMTPLANRLSILSHIETVDFDFPQNSWSTLNVLKDVRPTTFAYIPWSNESHMEKFIKKAAEELPDIHLQRLNLDTSGSSSSKLREMIQKL